MLPRNWMDVINFGALKIKVTSCWFGAETNRYFRIITCSLVSTPVNSSGAILYGVCSLKESSLKSHVCALKIGILLLNKELNGKDYFGQNYLMCFFQLTLKERTGACWCFFWNKNTLHFAFPSYFTLSLKIHQNDMWNVL